MRLIFLDIDGVLNDKSDFGHNCFEVQRLVRQGVIVPNDGFSLSTIVSVDKLVRFKQFVTEEDDTKVVLASTWREIPEARKFLVENCGLEFVGETPRSHFDRGYEICEWLNKCHDLYDKCPFVIFDDDTSVRKYAISDYWVCTGWEYGRGLNDNHIADARSILARQKV